MSDEQKPERKNKLKKRKVIGPNGVGYENGIYYNLKHTSNFDVLVSMRIEGKQVQKGKENIQFFGEAKKVRNKFLQELENLKAESMRGDMLWSKAVEQYFKHLESLMKENEISFSTYDDRVNSLTHNTKMWGNMKLSEIHTDFIREHLKNGITAQSNDTKRSILKYIRQVFTYQIQRGNRTLMHNPATGIKFKRISKPPRKTMSFEEIQILVNYSEQINSEWAPVYYLAFQLGCRSGELYALKWSDVDWVSNKLAVNHSYCWRHDEEKPPKNGKPRVIPLNDYVVSYLKELKTSSKTDDVYILPRIPAWKAGRAAAILAGTQEHLKITKTNFHSIRSAFITHLLRTDVAPVKVMELSGHEDLKTTMVYVREVKDGLKDSTNNLGFAPKKEKPDNTADLLNFPKKTPKNKKAS